MPTPHEDRWERTKRHLLRNFLVNPGFELSPIPEEERSSSDSDSGSLPDLIVERAPDRHDDPPAFYEGLEKRMTRLYRQLFLDANESDNQDSNDFEVSQSMTGSFIPNIDARTDNEADEHVGSNLDSSLTKEKQLTKSTEDHEDDARVNEDTYGDKLIIDTTTHNYPSHVSIDGSNRSSSIEDEDDQSIEYRSISNETEDNLSINEGNDLQNDNNNRQNLTNDIVHERSQTNEEESQIIKIQSLSEDSVEECHRVSTTVAQIHEPPVRGSALFDNASITSPVLKTRLLQFGRTVFRTRDVRLSGQNINIETSGENINLLPKHTAEDLKKQNVALEAPDTDVQRLLTTSDFTRNSIETEIDQESMGMHYISAIDWKKDDDENRSENVTGKGESARISLRFIMLNRDEDSLDGGLEPIAHSTVSEHMEPVESMRNSTDSEVNVSWHGEEEQASPALAFETRTSANRLGDVSSDSNEINASLEEPESEIEEETENQKEEEIENEIQEEETDNEIEEEETENEIEAEEGEIENQIEEGEKENEIEEEEDIENEIQADEGEIENEIDEEGIESEIEAAVENFASNPRDNARILDDFWSVSSMEVDIDELAQNITLNKRRSDSSDDAPPSKIKKDMAVQTNFDNKPKWEDIRRNLFVGKPLVYRLCRCNDHVCSVAALGEGEGGGAPGTS